MQDKPLPSELARLWGNNADLRYRGNDEWSSACPKCNPFGRGGRDPSDRFRMFGSGGPPRGWCRSCDYKAIAKNDEHRITQEEREQAKEQYVLWLQDENKRLRDKVRWLQEQRFWRRWHDDMGKDARELWHDAGIEDFLIETHQLGYTIERYQPNGGALTIPYIHEDQIQTIQFRLMIPPNKGDKYRFEQGTKANWFYPWPYDNISDVVLVAEGAKKAMVLWQTVAKGDKFVYRGVDVTIVASPSKNVPGRMIDDLDNADLVIWMLDPDAYDRPDSTSESVLERNTRLVGVEKCRHVRTLGKIDDMIQTHNLSHEWIQSAVEQASPVIMRNPGRRPTVKHL